MYNINVAQNIRTASVSYTHLDVYKRQTLVFGNNSNAFFNATGSIFHVSYSESMKIGFAFSYKTGFTVATKVKSEQKTLSLGLTSVSYTHLQ